MDDMKKAHKALLDKLETDRRLFQMNMEINRLKAINDFMVAQILLIGLLIAVCLLALAMAIPN